MKLYAKPWSNWLVPSFTRHSHALIAVLFGVAGASATASTEVMAWGNNEFAQCSGPVPDLYPYCVARPLGPYGVVQVAAGSAVTVALREDGVVLCWGMNQNGQCNVPIGLRDVRQVASGLLHTMALTRAGQVVCWGWNGNGQCTVPASSVPRRQVAAGGYHSLALRSDGTVVCWGRNTSGQCLGNNSQGVSYTYKAAGEIVRLGGLGLYGATQISGGELHSAALKDDSSVACWGENSNGQCNTPSGLTGVKQVVAAQDHTIALRLDGSVTCWGNDAWKQCVPPADLFDIDKIAVSGSVTVALTKSKTVRCWGDNWYGQCNVPEGVNNVRDIAAGSAYALALQSRCESDVDGNEFVDFADVAMVLLEFGACSPMPLCITDTDGSGEIDLGDIAYMLLDFGPCLN